MPPVGEPDGRADRSSMVLSVAHGLAILDLYLEPAQVIGIGEMALALGVHRSTTSRLAATLSARGYLEPAGSAGHYRLGSRVLELGALASRGLDVRAVAVEALRPIVDQVGETAHIGALDGREAITIAVVDGWHSVRLHAIVGKRSPAHCSSLGKALLLGLDDKQIRSLYPSPESFVAPTSRSIRSLEDLQQELARTQARGYSLDDEELETGLRCVGAPIFDRFGSVVLAISVSGPASRFTDDAIAPLAVQLQEVAGAISRRIALSNPTRSASALRFVESGAAGTMKTTGIE
jgi:DNA-binding IclR family transcriptional regulator